MPVLFSNNASTTLSAGINNSQTTIAIASSSGFPSLGSGEYYYGTIANTNNTKVEVVKVTAGTTSLTVTRAQDGTSAQAFDSGDNFQLRVTAATLDATSKSDVAITAGSVQADTLIAKGDGSSADGQIQLNCSQNSHGIKLKSPPHSAGASYTLTFPNDDGNANEYLQTNGSGVLSWNAVDLTALSATNLTSGTVPSARITASSIANDLIDSQHYADGSIDTAHIGDDQVTADKLANSINSEIAANTAKVTNATHTGEVTGATALTIADNVVDEANLKVSNTPTNGYFLSAQSGNTGGLTWAEVDTTIANDSIDSQHYAAGSIDHEHLAADCVDGDNIQDDVINSEHIAAGAVDLEHLSSESVDEDNLYISNAGSNGQFLQKQSGNNGGLTWATVSSEDYIPDGSVMVFFQANAPTGWTKVTTQNDKTLRVVSGTGGGTGGDWAMSAGETTSSHGGHVHSSAAHTHGGGNLAAAAHTLSTGQIASHSHSTGAGGSGYGVGANWNSSGGGGNTGSTGGGGSHEHSLSGNTSSTTPGDTGSAGSHTHTIAAPQYIDVIICSKDA